MEELAGIPLVGLTAPALLGIAVLLLLVGRIVPRTTYLDKKEEAEKWRLAYEAEREARGKSDRQTAELLEGLKTQSAVINAVFQAIQEINSVRSGGSDAKTK